MVRQRIPAKAHRPEPEAWDKVREMFDQWAEHGSGYGMQDGHMPLAKAILNEIPVSSNDTILDLSCGMGWFARHLAVEVVPKGQVIGVDLSPQMIETAREHPDNPKHLRFEVASAEELPFEGSTFDHIIGIESFYYYPDQVAAGHEMFRVMKPGGTFFIAFHFYLENRFSHPWRDLIDVSLHCKGADQYNTLFRACGFIDVGDQRIHEGEGHLKEPDGKWFRTADQLKGFYEEGALLISGRRPPEEEAE